MRWPADPHVMYQPTAGGNLPLSCERIWSVVPPSQSEPPLSLLCHHPSSPPPFPPFFNPSKASTTVACAHGFPLRAPPLQKRTKGCLRSIPRNGGEQNSASTTPPTPDSQRGATPNIAPFFDATPRRFSHPKTHPNTPDQRSTSRTRARFTRIMGGTKNNKTTTTAAEFGSISLGWPARRPKSG